MKKFFILLICCVSCISICAESEISLMQYFDENILKLDPIEGFYEAQWKSETNSPFASGQSGHLSMAIKQYGSQIKVYFKNNNFYEESTDISLSKVGETNAYVFTYYSTKSTIYLIDNNHWNASMELDLQSARHYSGNSQFGFRIWLSFQAIKSYPTTSMYLHATKKEIKKAEEELQKALEEDQKKAGWSGSGFALNEGHIVTNYHVVEDAKIILIKGVKGDFNTELRANIVATDRTNDLAILKIDDERFNGFGTIPYKVKRSVSDVGESVWALGYPMTSIMGEEVKFTDGKISSRTGIQGDISLYQISVPIQPGNSGGALFDNNGYIVGITSSGLNREEFNSENVNYAIKTSYLHTLVESTLSTSIMPQGTAMQGQPLTQKIKLAKNFVYIILCSSSPDFHANKQPSIDTGNVQNGSPSPKSHSYIYKSSNGNFVIESIDVTSVYTILNCKWHNTSNHSSRCSIDPKSYLKDCETSNIYKFVIGLKIAHVPAKTDVPQNSTLSFSLYFERVPDNVKVVDFIENSSSTWNCHGIRLK